jgi:hypothetical protein
VFVVLSSSPRRAFFYIILLPKENKLEIVRLKRKKKPTPTHSTGI